MYEIVTSETFQTVVLAALILAALIIMFLPENCSGCGIPFLAFIIIWLFFDFPIPKPWAVGLITIMTLAFLWGPFFVDTKWRYVGYSGTVVIIVAAPICFWWFWHSTVTARWVVAPAIFFALWLATAYGTPIPESSKTQVLIRNQEKGD